MSSRFQLLTDFRQHLIVVRITSILLGETVPRYGWLFVATIVVAFLGSVWPVTSSFVFESAKNVTCRITCGDDDDDAARLVLINALGCVAQIGSVALGVFVGWDYADM